MSKENALVELWHILDGKRKDDISLFEWRHRHLRAVWQANKDEKGKFVTTPPKNIIFGYYERGTKGKTSLEVAYALVDVIGRSLRVRPLAVRPPKGVWTFNKNKMGKPEDGPIALRKQNIELPTQDWSKAGPKKTNMRFVYQRGEPEYTKLLKDDILRVWATAAFKISSFFTKKKHPNLYRPTVSVDAENLSMGIKLKGLGFIRSPGPSTVIKTPVASAKAFALKQPKFSGIHYAGLGIGDFDTDKESERPLGMMFLDTLFLDSFSLTPHPKTKGVSWPPKGALVEFFKHPNLDVKSYTHRDGKPGKDRNEVKAENVTSYLLTKADGFIMEIRNKKSTKKYTPFNISFLFDEDKAGLQKALDGEYLMHVLVGNFKEFETFKKEMPQMFSANLLKDVALRFFGNKDFFKIETKEEESKETQGKYAELAVALEAAELIIERTTKIKTDFNDFGNNPNFSKDAVERTKEFETGLKVVLKQIDPIKTEIDNQKKTLTILHAWKPFPLKTLNDIDSATEGLDHVWTDLEKEIKTQIRAFLAADYASLTLLKKNMKISIQDTDRKSFNKNYTSDRDILVAAEKLRNTAKGYLTNEEDTKKWNNERDQLIALEAEMKEAVKKGKKKTDKEKEAEKKKEKAATQKYNTAVLAFAAQIKQLETNLKKIKTVPALEKKAAEFEATIRAQYMVVNQLGQDAVTAGADALDIGAKELKLARNGIRALKAIVAKKKKIPIPPIIKKKKKEALRQITYGSAKPAAATLYMLGTPGRIDVGRIREDPIYIGPEVGNLSNFSLEFYGSAGAALASSLSLGASIQAEDLIPKAVTVDAGRLEQTAFDYYYGAYWVDEYTGFETSGDSGNVTSFPGNYITIPEQGAILYHLGATTIGSISYDLGSMAQKVSLDNPDFEVMLQSAAVEDAEASPGSSRLATSGAIILGLRLPEGGSGPYSVRSIAYAPKLVKM